MQITLDGATSQLSPATHSPLNIKLHGLEEEICGDNNGMLICSYVTQII